jgi:hypothetical protein
MDIDETADLAPAVLEPIESGNSHTVADDIPHNTQFLIGSPVDQILQGPPSRLCIADLNYRSYLMKQGRLV